MLTKRQIDAFRFDPKGTAKQIMWDGELPGFGVRVFPTGRRAFVLHYRTKAGRSRLYTLGRYGVLTPAQAREKAVTTLAAVQAGADPVEQRKAARKAATLAELTPDYLAEAEPKLKPRSHAEYTRLIERHIVPKLGRKPVTDITTRDCAKLHHALNKTPYVANRTLDVLSIFMRWCERHGYRERNSNPCSDVEKFPEQGRERFLSVAEIGELGAALTRAEREGLPPAPQHRKRTKRADKLKHRPKTADKPIPANPFAIAAIRFLLLTGWREQEALTLRWADVDFTRKLATLPSSKTGKSHRPLGAPAFALLAGLPRVNGSPYVFPGLKEAQPLREIKRVWFAVRHAAKMPELRLHDLRHTLASVAVAGGHSLYVTGALLGHTRAETTRRYAHLNDDIRNAAADDVSTRIAEALAAPTTQNAAR